MTKTSTLLALLCWALLGSVAEAGCAALRHDGSDFTVCTYDIRQTPLRTWWQSPEGGPFGSFRAIDRALQAEGKELAFAMNGGMYHADRRPVGHYVEAGKELRPLVTRAGPGNFGLLPNGVFCIAATRVQVMESKAYARAKPTCDYASQSGPMLVIDGALHPRFLVDSSTSFIRNGVGVAADGVTVHFAISKDRVTFHQFGRLFRDALKTPNALYFDGKVSRLYDRETGRADAGFPLGPIVGFARPRNDG